MLTGGWIILGGTYFISVLLIVVGLFVGKPESDKHKSSTNPNSTNMKSEDGPTSSSKDAPTSSQVDNKGCLCVFDVDRTSTAYGDCPGTELGTEKDGAWGCNKTVQIAAKITDEIEKCKTAGCEIGVATDAGTSSFDGKINDPKWKSLWDGTKAVIDCQPCEAGENHGEATCPNLSYCQYAGNGDKGSELQSIEKQFKKDYGYYPAETYFYDDSTANLTNVCGTKLEGDVKISGGGCAGGCVKCCGLDGTSIWDRRKC